MVGDQGNMGQKDKDFDEWYSGNWCKICALTIGMANLGWCDWQKKLRTQGKECPKLKGMLYVTKGEDVPDSVTICFKTKGERKVEKF